MLLEKYHTLATVNFQTFVDPAKPELGKKDIKGDDVAESLKKKNGGSQLY